MASNYGDANVELSGFKPTENRVIGQEGVDRERILGNDPNSRDPFFDTKRELPGENLDSRYLHGNKGKNLSNLESNQIHEHIVDNNKRMASNYGDANVELSGFKPTENRIFGQEGVNRENILGNDPNSRDPFFDTKRELPGERFDIGNLHGNKGKNLGNLESNQIHGHIVDNNRRMASNFDQARVELSSFKPTENKVIGEQGVDRENILGNDPNSRDPFFDTVREIPGERFDNRQLHGNKGRNLGNLESSEMHQHVMDSNQKVIGTFSSFKPTENVILGQGKNRENILGNDPNTRDPFFDTKREFKDDKFRSGELHGNKGKNLGNIESKELHSHIIDNNQKMASNFQSGHVQLSNFKPTENVFRGFEKDRENILGNKLLTARDRDFTRSLEGQKRTEIGGNKGRNLSNVESSQIHDKIIDNNRRMAENYEDAGVQLSEFKPTENVFRGHEEVNRENILGNDPNSRDPFFDTKRTLPNENWEQGDLHGNKGKNLGNLESKDLQSHLADNTRKMTSRTERASIEASNFKPTQNIFRGRQETGQERKNLGVDNRNITGSA